MVYQYITCGASISPLSKMTICPRVVWKPSQNYPKVVPKWPKIFVKAPFMVCQYITCRTSTSPLSKMTICPWVVWRFSQNYPKVVPKWPEIFVKAPTMVCQYITCRTSISSLCNDKLSGNWTNSCPQQAETSNACETWIKWRLQRELERK